MRYACRAAVCVWSVQAIAEWKYREVCEDFVDVGSCGIGFSLWIFVLARPKPHRLKPMPQKALP